MACLSEHSGEIIPHAAGPPHFPPKAPISVPLASRARFQPSAHWPFPYCLLVARDVNDAAGLFAPEGNTATRFAIGLYACYNLA